MTELAEHESRDTAGKTTLVLCIAFLVLGACGPEPNDGDDDAAQSEGGTSSSAGAWPPDECPADESPFLREECLEALRLGCNAHVAENECMAAPPVSLDEGGYTVRCLWAKVVAFSDVGSCSIESVTGRCEASEGAPLCGDFCAGDPWMSDVSAISAEQEIIDMCGGPLGAWAAVGSSSSDDVLPCGPDYSPESPPALCECATVACEAD